MESSLLGRLFKSIFKFVLSSMVVGSISLVASTSFMTGKFPPDWKQVKNMLSSIQKLRDFQKVAGKGLGNGGMNPEQLLQVSAQLTKQQGGQQQGIQQQQGQQQVGQQPPFGNQQQSGSTTKNNGGGFNDDPELADVRDLMQSHQNMRNLAANLNGEKALDPTGASSNNQVLNNPNLSASNNNNQRAIQPPGQPASPNSSEGRVRALEVQVDNLTLRLRSLTATIMELNDKVDRLQRAKR
jgi:hypothetical protein